MNPSEPMGKKPDSIAKAILAARLEFVFGGQPMALAVAVVLAAILVFVLRDSAPFPLLLGWLGCLIAVNAARGLAYRRYRSIRQGGMEYALLTRWERIFFTGCLAAGIVWGSSSILFFPDDSRLQLFLAFMLAGVTSGALTELSVAPRAALLFVAPCALPLAARLLAQGDTLHVAAGLMACLYIGLVSFSARRGSAQLVRTVRSQLDATASRHALTDSEVNRQASEERLRLATQAGQIGVWEWDVRKNVLDWDNRMYEMYRIQPQSGSSNYEMWRQRVHPLDLKRSDTELNDAVSQGCDYNSEFRILWPDGEEHFIKAAGRVSRDEAGKALRVTGINLDITELKRVERLKSEFVSVVSHELRTPLTSIRGSLSLVTNDAAGVIPEKAKQLLQLADRNAERLTLLINDLLDIEKIESGRMRYEMQRQSTLDLVLQSIEANSAYAMARGVNLGLLEKPAADLSILADANRFLQVMANLLSNAAKFSPVGSTVEVKIHERDKRARVEVRDHGPGISSKFQEQLFAKFSQGDSSDSRSKGGTGLGLAISKAIVEQMGGTIGYNTQPGEGTTFFFELPLHDDTCTHEKIGEQPTQGTVALPLQPD